MVNIIAVSLMIISFVIYLIMVSISMYNDIRHRKLSVAEAIFSGLMYTAIGVGGYIMVAAIVMFIKANFF